MQKATVAGRPAAAWLIDSADFWRLWFVGLVVFVVRWVETVAVGVFVYQHTGSAFIVAMMTMLRLLPMGLFGAFIGAIAERMERRTTLIVVVASMVARRWRWRSWRICNCSPSGTWRSPASSTASAGRPTIRCGG